MQKIKVFPLVKYGLSFLSLSIAAASVYMEMWWLAGVCIAVPLAVDWFFRLRYEYIRYRLSFIASKLGQNKEKMEKIIILSKPDNHYYIVKNEGIRANINGELEVNFIYGEGDVIPSREIEPFALEESVITYFGSSIFLYVVSLLISGSVLALEWWIYGSMYFLSIVLLLCILLPFYSKATFKYAKVLRLVNKMNLNIDELDDVLNVCVENILRPEHEHFFQVETILSPTGEMVIHFLDDEGKYYILDFKSRLDIIAFLKTQDNVFDEEMEREQ